MVPDVAHLGVKEVSAETEEGEACLEDLVQEEELDVATVEVAPVEEEEEATAGQEGTAREGDLEAQAETGGLK